MKVEKLKFLGSKHQGTLVVFEFEDRILIRRRRGTLIPPEIVEYIALKYSDAVTAPLSLTIEKADDKIIVKGDDGFLSYLPNQGFAVVNLPAKVIPQYLSKLKYKEDNCYILWHAKNETD